MVRALSSGSIIPSHTRCLVPSPDEVTFVLDVLDQVATPALDRVEALLDKTSTWDNVDRNDFCRYI